MTTYGLIVSLVAVAALTALVAVLADRPEWRVPRRRRPVLSLARLVTPDGAPVWALDPARPAWDAALVETTTRATAAGLDGWTGMTPVDLDTAIATRPTVAVIDGMAALALAGTPFDLVRDEMSRAVAELASVGSRSVVLGMATQSKVCSVAGPSDRATIAAVAARRRAQHDLIAGWNDQVAADIAPYGGVLVTDPGALPDVVGRLARARFVPELEEADLTIAAGSRQRLA